MKKAKQERNTSLKKLLLAVAGAALVTTGFISAANAGTFIQQKGNTNPLTEGWEKWPSVSSGVYPTVGRITNDLGLRINAWSVNDLGTNLGDLGGYAHYITTCQVNEAKTKGWKLRAKLRVVNNNSSNSNVVLYRDGQKTYQMFFGSTASGDPIVTLVTGLNGSGINYTLTGGANSYHLYEIVMPPGGTSAKLFVDGVERISSYSGFALTENRPYILFGAGSSYASGNVNYNLVQFVHP